LRVNTIRRAWLRNKTADERFGASHQDRGFAPIALSRHALCRVGRTIQRAFAFVGSLGPYSAQTGHVFFCCSLFGKRDKLFHEHALGMHLESIMRHKQTFTHHYIYARILKSLGVLRARETQRLRLVSARASLTRSRCVRARNFQGFSSSCLGLSGGLQCFDPAASPVCIARARFVPVHLVMRPAKCLRKTWYAVFVCLFLPQFPALPAIQEIQELE
jgi:hypothetical protein